MDSNFFDKLNDVFLLSMFTIIILGTIVVFCFVIGDMLLSKPSDKNDKIAAIESEIEEIWTVLKLLVKAMEENTEEENEKEIKKNQKKLDKWKKIIHNKGMLKKHQIQLLFKGTKWSN